MRNRFKLAIALLLVGLILAVTGRHRLPLHPPAAEPDAPGHPAPTPARPLPAPPAPLMTPLLPDPTQAALSATDTVLVASTETRLPDGTLRRVRILKTPFKYPLWREESLLQPGDATHPDAVRSCQLMIADHAVVALHTPADGAALAARAAQLGLSLRRALHTPGRYLVSTPDPSPEALPRLLALLRQDPALIRYAEPDYVVHALDTVPNDPMFSALWGLRNSGRPGSDISATRAWDLATGGTQAVVAVIDTGIAYTHPDLAVNIWSNTAESANGLDDDGNGFIDDVRGWNFVADNNNPMDDHSHGTHCAGTIGALGNNALGVAGVNWTCRIIPLKFLDASGNGVDSDAADALHYVAELRRRGVNIRLTSNSWGGGDYTTALRDAIAENASLGILFAAAAGNNGLDNDQYAFYPASYGESNMLVVAATDSNDSLAYFSNYGAASVDLAAPGVTILSTVLNNTYGYKSGTSMATPHVAGVATLLFNAWPSAPADAVRDALRRGVDPVPSLAGLTLTGGRLNALKSLQRLFRIVHTPLEDQFITNADYAVTADIGPACFLATNSLPILYWNADGSTNYNALPLARLDLSHFQAAIPCQPRGSLVQYWIKAPSTLLPAVTFPTNAPALVCQFHVTPPSTLTVSGVPDLIGAISPPYGTQTYPSGKVFQAWAPLATPPSNGMRWACAGWTGTGSVPATGSTNTVAFTLSADSSLTWQWRREYALTQTNAYTAALNRTTWWPEHSLAQTLTADVALVAGGSNLMFTGWTLDGARQPDATHPASNPALGITMDQPHLARACYLADTLDADTNAISDWWESFFFGAAGINPDADPDGDGFSNRAEFLDRTDPTDPASRPTPPAILHTPLASPQPHPAPFEVVAIITDNFKVASTLFCWTRNGGPPVTNVMQNISNTCYRTSLPAPGTNTDQFQYWIMASDLLATRTNGPNTVIPSYPVTCVAPQVYRPLMAPAISSNLTLVITNSGTAPLFAEARILPGGLACDMEAGTSDWTHSGTNDLWTLSTNRSRSGSTAWYCGNPATHVYASNMKARLDTPPVYLTAGATLTFSHWIQSELDGQFWRPDWHANSCWDGGLVELSTNNGATFFTLTPVGGYPNLISGYYASPWPDQTPCYAGTGAWTQATFDLASFTDKVVIVRFEFGSDENTEEEGWYIDDVTLSPTTGPPGWLSLVSPAVTANAAMVSSLPFVHLDTGGIPTGDRRAALWLTSNDPLTPNTSLPLHLRVRSPGRLAWQQAAQTSTDGTGIVSFRSQASDADGDPCSLELQWSGGDGVWSNLWLASLGASQGSVSWSNIPLPFISNILTTAGGSLQTNQLSGTWTTLRPGYGPLFTTSAMIRGRLSDPLLTGDWTTCQPFMVDNELPPTPTHFLSLVHRTNTWSMNPVMNLRWDAMQESRGTGVTNYLFGTTTNPIPTPPQGSTANRTTLTAPVGDGTNLWAWVASRDGAGNVSAPAWFGPCWVDANPPTPTQAVVSLVLSPFGNYLVGASSITGSWSGFTDAGSGIAGYYYALTNASGTSKGQWTTNLAGVLSGLGADRTNTFFVWAQDRLGWIGQAASVSFLDLSPDGDWDHDGQLNREEETAGTDAANAASQFHLHLAHDAGQAGNRFEIRWPGLSNRHYGIRYSDTLAPALWLQLAGATNLAGINGTMSWSDRTDMLPHRFYRITITSP